MIFLYRVSGLVCTVSRGDIIFTEWNSICEPGELQVEEFSFMRYLMGLLFGGN